jgi:hypothetical protein
MIMQLLQLIPSAVLPSPQFFHYISSEMKKMCQETKKHMHVMCMYVSSLMACDAEYTITYNGLRFSKQ